MAQTGVVSVHLHAVIGSILSSIPRGSIWGLFSFRQFYLSGRKISSQLGKYSNLDQAEENYSSIDWFVKCLTNYANFSGRARRKEFWFFMLFCVILGIIAEVIDTVLGTKPLVNSLLNLALLVPSLAVGARRLHDVGRSGWWQLLTLTVIGILVLIWWWAIETKQQNNEYGAPAK